MRPLVAVAVQRRNLDQAGQGCRRRLATAEQLQAQLMRGLACFLASGAFRAHPGAARCMWLLIAAAVQRRDLDQAGRQCRRRSPPRSSGRRSRRGTWRAVWGAELAEPTPARLAASGCLLQPPCSAATSTRRVGGAGAGRHHGSATGAADAGLGVLSGELSSQSPPRRGLLHAAACRSCRAAPRPRPGGSGAQTQVATAEQLEV